jgi:hypothetical protein
MGASRVHKVDAKRVKDPVYGWAFIEEVAKEFPFLSAVEELAGRSKQQALKEKAGALPPAQRVEHLKKRLKRRRKSCRGDARRWSPSRRRLTAYNRASSRRWRDVTIKTTLSDSWAWSCRTRKPNFHPHQESSQWAVNYHRAIGAWRRH